MKPTIKGIRTFRNAQIKQNTKISPSIKTMSRQYFLVNPPTELKSNLCYFDLDFDIK